jgi:hypothetical protein
VATSSQSRAEPKFPDATMYLNLRPTFITKIREKLVQKICYNRCEQKITLGWNWKKLKNTKQSALEYLQ